MKIPSLMSESVGYELRNLSVWGAKRLHPHQRCTETPSKGHPVPQKIWFSWLTVFWRSSRESNCNLQHCKRVSYLAIAEIPPSLFFSDTMAFYWNCWSFSFEKQLWNAERGDSQNYVRKLHPLHLLQLPVFTMSFAVLIQGCQEKQNKNREGTFSTLSTWHQVLQTAHFTSENILPDRLILFQMLIFFFRFYNVFALLVIFSIFH